jgi:3-oxoacyl-[acyl-carrier protein] reductase
MTLDGKVALVTGGSRGLGRAVCREFARHGARVVACGRSAEALDDMCRQIRGECGGAAEAIVCDVASSAEVDALFARIADRHGRLDVLVNNAAIVPDTPADVQRRNRFMALATTPVPRQSLGVTRELSDADWLRFWDVNVHGVFYCTRAALRLMEPRRSGKIVNIASTAGISGSSAHSPHYAATKGAVVAFTKAVAVEVAGANVYVNCIAAGGILTLAMEEYLQRLDDETSRRLFQLIPLGRIGKPQEYASLAAYLASDNHYLVGQVISPNGGMVV